MADPANAEAETEQEAVTPAPLGAVDSLAEYRERRAEADGVPEDGEPKAAEVKPEPKAEDEAQAEPDPASDAGKALAKKRGSLQARIDELTREKHQTASEAQAAKAERDALRAELAALKAGKQPEPKAAEKVEPAALEVDPNDPEPKPEKFDDYEKYIAAKARWEARQEIRAERATSEKRQAETARGERLSRVMSAGAEAHPDFHEKAAAYESAGGEYSPVAQDIILNHKLGHEFAYALISDPAIANRINGAESPAIAMLEAGAVLAEIRKAQEAAKAPKEPKPKPVSKAPAPVEPITSGESAAADPDPAKMNSLAEYRRLRPKLIAA